MSDASLCAKSPSFSAIIEAVTESVCAACLSAYWYVWIFMKSNTLNPPEYLETLFVGRV